MTKIHGIRADELRSPAVLCFHQRLRMIILKSLLKCINYLKLLQVTAYKFGGLLRLTEIKFWWSQFVSI